MLADVGVRIDVVERLAARLRAGRAAPFELELELLRLTGLGQPELIPVVEALGYALMPTVGFADAAASPWPPAAGPHRATLATPFAALGRIRGNR